MSVDGPPAAHPATWHYRIAGLGVRSSISLPLDPVAAADVDVEVVDREASEVADAPSGGPRLVAGGDDREITLRWRGLASMTIEAGRGMSVVRDPGVASDDVAPLVLGVGMGLILHQRGRLVLHASAVHLPRGAVAFVGMKGAGKSTMAGALTARGALIIADDALPVDMNGHTAQAWPGPTALKLWPESVTAIGRSPRRVRRLHPRASKRVVVDLMATSQPVPLHAIYSLHVGNDLSVEPMHGHAAVVELIRHSYAARFVPSLGATPEHFSRCVRLAESVQMFSLARPAALDRLAEVAEFVEEHVAGLE
jgi:hypothetical protein